MENLFDERLEEPALCRAILTAVAAGNGDPVNLSRQTGIPYDDLAPHLYFLRLLKLVEDRYSVHDENPRRRIRHVVAEPSLVFYHQHLRLALDKQSAKEAAVSAYVNLRQSLGGEPFFALCRERSVSINWPTVSCGC